MQGPVLNPSTVLGKKKLKRKEIKGWMDRVGKEGRKTNEKKN